MAPGVPYNRGDLYLSEAGPSGWGPPRHLDRPINSTAVDCCAGWSRDGQSVVFSSERNFITESDSVPLLDPTPVRSETCLYTMTPDEDFVLDRVGNVVVGAGFSGHGFKFGPLIGEVLADLALGREPRIPLERFSARREALAASR